MLSHARKFACSIAQFGWATFAIMQKLLRHHRQTPESQNLRDRLRLTEMKEMPAWFLMFNQRRLTLIRQVKVARKVRTLL